MITIKIDLNMYGDIVMEDYKSINKIDLYDIINIFSYIPKTIYTYLTVFSDIREFFPIKEHSISYCLL